jgi:hypothetical protein
MYPTLADKDDVPGRREQGKMPSGLSASDAMYGRKEVERKFYNPALVRVPGLTAKRSK